MNETSVTIPAPTSAGRYWRRCGLASLGALGWLSLLSGCNPELMRNGWGGGSLFGGPPGKGEPWSIEVVRVEGTERREILDETAESLRRTKGIRPDDVVVEHEPGFSRILYGRYTRQRRRDSLRLTPSKQMEDDLFLIRSLAGPGNVRYFPLAKTVAIESPDVGPPEWDLRTNSGIYSLQVAAFYNTGEFDDRKGAAAEYTKQLRDKGHEAWYLHGPQVSIVTVGSFGPDAVESIDTPVRNIRDEEGRRMRVEATDLTSRYSAKVVALQQKETFQYNLTNGHKVYNVRGGRRVPVPSALVRISDAAP